MIPGHTTHTAPIGMSSPKDSWPTHKAVWGLGGYRTVQSYVELEKITTGRREAGMIVYVIEDRSTWRLLEDLVSWEDLGAGSSGCCVLLEWAIQDLDTVAVADLDGVLTLEPGEEDYPFVYRHGDTMTGPLILSEHPEPGVDPPLQAATYQWVLDQLAQFQPIIHRQMTPVNYLLLPHPLGRPPTVQLMDGTGRIMLGQVIPTDTDVEFKFEQTLSFVAILT